MKRCLIIGCSEAKVQSPELLPAIQRYNGPPFRVLRRFLTNRPQTDKAGAIDVYVLSAEFGLISGQQLIPVYDRRMTHHRAEQLRPKVLDTLKGEIADHHYAELFLSMGKTYLLALEGYEKLLPPETKVIVSRSTSGRKLSELKAWLNGGELPTRPLLPFNEAIQNEHKPRRVNGVARLRGTDLAYTPNEVIQIARQALAAGVGKPFALKDWYVLVDGAKVGPKWLVSQLSNLPVRDFDASEARRVLHALGVDIYRNE